MTIALDVGAMRHRIEIQESSRSKGAQGTQIDTWTTIAKRWGRISETKDEKFSVEMRFFDGLVPTAKKVLGADDIEIAVNRLKHGTRVLNIEDVLNTGSFNQVIRLLCTRDPQTF